MSAHANIEGNLSADPELRFTKDGKAVCTFRIASTDRRKNQAGDWEDAGTLWVNVTLWDRKGEAFAETARKGNRVIVAGKLRMETWTSKDGEPRESLKLDADVAGVIAKAQPQAASAPF